MTNKIKFFKKINSVSSPTVSDDGVYFVKPVGGSSRFNMEIIDSGIKYNFNALDYSHPAANITSSDIDKWNLGNDSYPIIDGNNIIDYNNVKKMGRYSITSDALQQAMLNKPSNYSGVLEVTFSDNTTWIFQRFTEYSGTQNVYHRRFYNGDWTNWVLSHNNLNFDFNNKSSEHAVLQNLNNSLETSKPYHQVERGFKWINGTVENFGQFNSATGSFISFGNSGHKGQLLVNKTGILFRGIYGDNDNPNWSSVWHDGNFNPDTKANTTGNYQGLIVGNSTTWNGQTYTSVEFTGTPRWLLTYDISVDSWKPTSNITVSNWLRPEVNKVNPIGLKEATYGNWFGVVQEYSESNPTNDWYNKLKILHDNSGGYSTELAQNFGSAGIFYRSTIQGQTSNWTKLWDKHDFNDTRVSNWDTAYNSIGFPLSNLTTNNKTSLVGAVNEVNNIQIGGRNLIIQSRLQPGYLNAGTGDAVGVAPDHHDPNYYDCNENDVFIHTTYEIYTSGYGGGGYMCFYDINKVFISSFVLSQNGIKSSKIVNAPQNARYYRVASIGKGLKEKLEKGNKATDWTPAPEDQVSNWAETNSDSLSFIKGKEIVNNEFNNIYDQISSRANNRLSNLASDLSVDEKRVIQDKTGVVSKTGSALTGNLEFIGIDKGVVFNNTWIWRADSSNNLNLTRIGVVDNVLLVDANRLNLGVGTHNTIARITANSADSIENNSNAYAPDNTKLALLNGNRYGTLFYTLGTGVGVIQQQRVDGNAEAYTLNLNPKGGGVKIDSINRNFDGNALQVYGKVITWGREDAYVMQFANQSLVNKIVAGTEYRWYNEYWKIGNRRGESSYSIGFDFELNGVNKVSIAPDSNISTQNYGNSSEWKTAYRSITLQNVSDLNTGAIGFGVYRQETPDNAYRYTTTLNLNSGDGRQQLMIDRSGAGMMFRGSPHGDATNNWSPWQHVKTGWSRVVQIESLASGKYVGLRLCQTKIGPMRVVVTVTSNFGNSNVGGGNLVKEFAFHDNGVDGFYSWNSRSLSANGSTAEAYKLIDLYVTEGHISTNLFGLTGASLGNPVTIHIDYYPHVPNLAYDKLTPYVTGLLDYDFVMLPDNETALNDGSNTVGGTWKIDAINSARLEAAVGNGQIFNAVGNTIYWGNPNIPLHTFEASNANAMRLYVPSLGYGQIWNGHNFDPSSKANISGDNVVPNSKWNIYSKGIYGALDSDFWRIQGNLVSSNNIELELATADDATEAIVVRQYSGEFASKVREAYLLDSSGNTSFPGTVTAQRFRMTGNTGTPAGVVSTESSIWQLGGDWGYGISMNQGGGLDIMANQPSQPIRLWSGRTNASPYKSMELNGSSVTVYGGIFTTNYGNSDHWFQAYNWGNHKAVDSHQYLGATYVYGGIRTPADFGAGRLKLEMVNSSVLGNGQGWNDVLWLSSYTGGDVPGSNALIMSKTSDEIGFARQNFDSETWGTYRKIWHSGNFDATDVMLKGSAQDVTGHKRFFTNGSEYYDASVELITNNASLVPSLGFHASGRFAGTLKMIDANSFTFYKQGSIGHANLYVGSIVSSGSGNFSSLEISSAQPFIDFHYNKSSADYTSRIIETDLGHLQNVVKSKFSVRIDGQSTPLLDIHQTRITLGQDNTNFSEIYLRTFNGSLDLDDEGLNYRPKNTDSYFNVQCNLEVFKNINGLKLKGRGSLGNPVDIISGNLLASYVLGNNDSKNGIGVFRTENTVWKGDVPVLTQYGASLLVQSGDTMFTLSANPFNPEIFVSGGGNSNNILWNKKLAFTENHVQISAPSFRNTSLRKFKDNIKDFKVSGLELITSLDIVTFDRNDTKEKDVIGIIADDTNKEFLSPEKDSVDLYKTIFIQAKAIQELNNKVNKLEELVNKMLGN